MAESAEQQQPQTILIAHVTVHFVDGSNFELYPFVDAEDVKAKVTELIEGWAKSGFLLRGARIYPWHQVKVLETTSVEEITQQDAQQRLMHWQAEDEKKAVLGFWKTKKEKKDDKKEGGESASQGGH